MDLWTIKCWQVIYLCAKVSGFRPTILKSSPHSSSGSPAPFCTATVKEDICSLFPTVPKISVAAWVSLQCKWLTKLDGDEEIHRRTKTNTSTLTVFKVLRFLPRGVHKTSFLIWKHYRLPASDLSCSVTMNKQWFCILEGECKPRNYTFIQTFILLTPSKQFFMKL